MSTNTNSELRGEAPSGDVTDNSYVSRPGNKGEPLGVVSDQERLQEGVDPRTADTDEQLARDDKEAIDKDNIINDRTRGAAPKKGAYREPGDEEGLPNQDGTSSTR